MKVTLVISGSMERFFPQNSYSLTLADGATLADLYDLLGRASGESISNAVWNREKSRPRGPIIVRSEGGVIKDEQQPLINGQTIELKRFLIGG